MASERGAQHEHGDCGARSFAEPHTEIEQRLKAKLLKQHAVTSLGGFVAGKGMIERVRAKLGQGRNGGGADKAIEQNGNASVPRGERSAENGGKLATAERSCEAQRIAEDGAVSGERPVNHIALALQALLVEACAVTGEAGAAAAEQRRGNG